MNREEFGAKYPGKSFGEINIKRRWDYPLTGNKDKRGNVERDYSVNAQIIDKGWEFYLNHSCDEWVIGNLESAEDFNRNLSEAIEYIKKNP